MHACVHLPPVSSQSILPRYHKRWASSKRHPRNTRVKYRHSKVNAVESASFVKIIHHIQQYCNYSNSEKVPFSWHFHFHGVLVPPFSRFFLFYSLRIIRTSHSATWQWSRSNSLSMSCCSIWRLFSLQILPRTKQEWSQPLQLLDCLFFLVSYKEPVINVCMLSMLLFYSTWI